MTDVEFITSVTAVIEFMATKPQHKMEKAAILRASAHVLDSLAQAEMSMAAVLKFVHGDEGAMQ